MNTIAAQDISKLSFEQAMEELNQILLKLEKGSIPLAESVAAYERGELIKKHCYNLLKQAELKIEKLKIDETGNVVGKENLEERNNSYIDKDETNH